MVAKREKPAKIEQRKIGPQVEQTTLLANPVYIGQARGRGKNKEKEEPKGWDSAPTPQPLQAGALFSSIFGSTCPHASRMDFPVIM